MNTYLRSNLLCWNHFYSCDIEENERKKTECLSANVFVWVFEANLVHKESTLVQCHAMHKSQLWQNCMAFPFKKPNKCTRCTENTHKVIQPPTTTYNAQIPDRIILHVSLFACNSRNCTLRSLLEESIKSKNWIVFSCENGKFSF